MGKRWYNEEFHPNFFDTLDEEVKGMEEPELELFYQLLEHELGVLKKNPLHNTRECKYGVLKDGGFRTMSFHSKLPRIGTGDMRIILKVDEDTRTVLYFAVGKRVNKRPRPAEDIYAKVEKLLKDNE